MKIVGDESVKLYPKNSQRFFESGVIALVDTVQHVATPFRTWRVEEDQVLLECGIFIGTTSDDDAGATLEGAVNIADIAQIGIVQLAQAVNPIQLAMYDYHRHQWIAGAAGGFSHLWNGWKVFHYKGFKWVLEEDDYIYVNAAFLSTHTVNVNVQYAAYMITGRKK